jgi:tetratricopeptide (TPR) repeat protein
MLIIPLSLLDIKGSVTTIAQDIDLHSRETVDISRADYLATEFRVIVTYLRLLILPANQSLDYNYPVYHSFLDLHVFLSLLFLLLVFGLGVYFLYISRIKSPGVQNSSAILRLISFGIFWFFITLSVESSIIPIRDVIVEHRLYLPSIGFFIAAVSLIEYLLPYIKVKAALMVIILVLLSIGTYSRNVIWKDPQTLWMDVIAKAPNNSRAYNNLGVVFKKEGEFDKAIEQFEKSLEANRHYTASYFNLGDVQYRIGKYESAIAYLKKALAEKPDFQLHLDILNKLGRTYSAMGQIDKSTETFEGAVKLFPSSVVLLNNLGVQYIKNNQIDSAIQVLEKAIMIKEKAYLYSNLASAYAKKGDEEKSRLMSQRALELGNNYEQ